MSAIEKARKRAREAAAKELAWNATEGMLASKGFTPPYRPEYLQQHWQDHLPEASIALAAYEAVLKEEGMVVVPREPSENMQRAAARHLGFHPDERPGWATAVRMSMWREMISIAESEAALSASEIKE